MTDSLQHDTIAIIGLGLMGQAFAKRWLAAGFTVVGYDVNAAQCQAFDQLSGSVLASARQAGERAHRIVLSLPDHAVAAQVIEELKPLLTTSHVIIDTTTGSHEAAERLAASLAAQGVIYLDATISGSSTQVEAGNATVMVGGNTEAFAQCRDLFACLGPQCLHTGPSGSGAKMKLITNLVLGLNRAALAEGLAFARALDLDGEQVLAVLRASMAYSRIMDTKGEKMLHGDFTPQARLTQHLKDVRLMLDATNMNLPLTEAHRGLLERAEAMGFGALDNSAIIKAYDS